MKELDQSHTQPISNPPAVFFGQWKGLILESLRMLAVKAEQTTPNTFAISDSIIVAWLPKSAASSWY